MSGGGGAHAFFADWLDTPFKVWGLGLLACSTSGFVVSCVLLELLVRVPGMAACKIVYGKAASRPPPSVPAARQLRVVAEVLLGPGALVGVGIGMVLFGCVNPPPFGDPPALWLGLAQFVAMHVAADFGLYWGHRLQHEFDFLWKFHSLHHTIKDPTPMSTLYLHPVDATIQGGLPLLLASALVRPHPFVVYALVFLRICENVLNHSGLDNAVLDVLTLKVLPLRASVAHHDAHHKFSNYKGKAKNYGETLWVWDWVFGSLSVKQN